MNALMRLNQIRPGLQYKLLSQSGPVHAPVFTMSVDVDGTVYEASGSSKKTAKLHVAVKVSNTVTARMWVSVCVLGCLAVCHSSILLSSCLLVSCLSHMFPCVVDMLLQLLYYIVTKITVNKLLQYNKQSDIVLAVNSNIM